MLARLLAHWSRGGKRTILAACLGMLLLIAWLDYVTTVEVSLLSFYWLPIGLATWYCGLAPGLGMAVVGVAAATCTDYLGGKIWGHPFFLLWEVSTRVISFSIFVWVMRQLRIAYDREAVALETSQQNAQLKSDMISLINHEYANALTSMKLAVLLLRDSEAARTSVERENHCDVLDRAIEHLCTATLNFLNLNRIESGHLLLNIRRTRMRSAARETLQLLKPLIAARKIHLRTDFPDTPVPVRADPEALAIIMSNLIGNAVKYTPSGGTITVRIAKEGRDPSLVLVAVEDTGIGFSAQQRDLIMSGHYRTPEGRKAAKGFGIGLMLVRELIERHGSRLLIDSRPGEGSRFSFYLSLAEGPGEKESGQGEDRGA